MIDATDKKILSLLSQNADITAHALGAAVGLSIPAVSKRVLKLKEKKLIRRHTILTDGKQLGKPVAAFIFLVLQYGDGVELLMKYVSRDPDILECHAVTGEYDYIIKVCAASVEALEEKLLFLKKQKGVVKSHTMLSLAEHKLSPTVLPD